MRRKIAMMILLTIGISASVMAQDWLTSLEQAQTKAKTTNRNILLVFSGSDWCVPCMKLEKNIWESNEFKTFSKDHFVLLKAEFVKQKKNKLSEEQQSYNEKLAEKYNPQGYFPLVVLLDKEGKVIGNTGYKNVTPSEYIRQLENLEHL